MSYQNNNQYRGRSDGYESTEYRGKRFRAGDEPDYDENFDVEQPAYSQPRQQGYQQSQGYQPVDRGSYPQGYGGYRQGNSGRSRQQYNDNYQQSYYGRDRDRYYDDYQSYDNRSGNSGYDRRYYDRRSRGDYDDSYNGRSSRYSERQRAPYDDRYYDDRPRKQKKRTGTAIIVVRVIAILMLLVGGYIVGSKLYSYYMDNKGHGKLQAMSDDYNQLYEMNNDFFGWLRIQDTVIDYPVMYSPDEPERYLHMDFDGNYSESGELFADAECDPDGYHYLIYGHHMFNGSMFGSLPKYEDTDYYNEHKTIRFDTRFETGEYEVFAVFYSKVYDDSEDVFKYYNNANLNDQGTYDYYVQNVKALSIYDTGITPVYGEKIITLSTCNYHTDDGRFVVCAKKIA